MDLHSLGCFLLWSCHLLRITCPEQPLLLYPGSQNKGIWSRTKSNWKPGVKQDPLKARQTQTGPGNQNQCEDQRSGENNVCSYKPLKFDDYYVALFQQKLTNSTHHAYLYKTEIIYTYICENYFRNCKS